MSRDLSQADTRTHTHADARTHELAAEEVLLLTVASAGLSLVLAVGIVSSDGQRALAGSADVFNEGNRVVGRRQTVVNHVYDLQTVFINHSYRYLLGAARYEYSLVKCLQVLVG